MAKEKTFTKAGDTDEKVTWNSAGTRKWKMTYTLLEVKPSWRSKDKAQTADEQDSSQEVATEKKSKKTTKNKTKPTRKEKQLDLKIR